MLGKGDLYPRKWRQRSVLCPVAAVTAGVKDKPGWAILLVCDSICAVPEGISVIRHWVEAISFVGTVSSTFRAAAFISTPTFISRIAAGLTGLSGGATG